MMELDASQPPPAATADAGVVATIPSPAPRPPPPNPRRLLAPPRHYLLVHVSFTPPLDSLTPLIFRSVLTESIRSLFGIIGASLYPVDVLSFDPATCAGLISIDAAHLTPVHSAFTLTGRTDAGRQCHIRVTRSSAFLPALSVNPSMYQVQLRSSTT